MNQACFQGDAMTAAGIVGLVFIVLLVTMVISLLPTVFYLLTLQKAFTRCQPKNRAMVPGLVWLMLIPFFSIIWHFFVVINMGESLHREFTERGLEAEPFPGKSMGLAMCILNVCGIIPYLGIIAGLAGFVCWIIYWVKIADYSARLACDVPPAMDALPSAE